MARVLTPELLEDFFLLLSVGLSRRQAAARLGLEHSTISHAAANDEELAGLLRRAEDMAGGEPILCLIAASRKNWRAALSLIQFKRQNPPKLDKEEKDQRMREKLEDTRREMEYRQQVDFLDLVAQIGLGSCGPRAVRKTGAEKPPKVRQSGIWILRSPMVAMPRNGTDGVHGDEAGPFDRSRQQRSA